MKKIVFIAIFALNFALAQTLKVGTNVNYEPFEYLNMSFEIVGFDIGMIEEISKRAGFKYELVNMEFNELIPALTSQKIDIIVAALSITNDRMSSVNFTNPYYESDNLYIKRRNDTALKSKESLKGKKLGVLQGSEQEMITSSVDGVDIVKFKNISGAIMELNKRNLDAILVDEAIGKHYISKSQNLEEFLKESYINIGFAFAVSKQSDPELLNSLNLALDEMMLDGTYELILEKYGLKDKM